MPELVIWRTQLPHGHLDLVIRPGKIVIRWDAYDLVEFTIDIIQQISKNLEIEEKLG